MFLIQFQPPGAYDVLVCTIGRKTMEKERMLLVRELWSAGIKAEILHATLEVFISIYIHIILMFQYLENFLHLLFSENSGFQWLYCLFY